MPVESSSTIIKPREGLGKTMSSGSALTILRKREVGVGWIVIRDANLLGPPV